MKTRKILSILLTLAIMMGLLCTGAMATDPTNLSPYDDNVSSITISGVDVTGSTRSDEIFNQYQNNRRVTYNIALASSTDDDATISLSVVGKNGNTVSPIPAAGPLHQFGPMISNNATTSYSVTLSGGVGSKTVYVHKNFPSDYGKYDAYVFNFSVVSGPTPQATLTDTGNTGLSMQFGDPDYAPSSPEQDMFFLDSGTAHKYNVIYTGSLSAYYPDLLAFYVTSGASTITAMNGGQAVHFVEFDATTGEISYEGSTPNPNDSTALNKGFYALKVIAEGDLTIQANGETLTLHFYDPHEAVTPASGAIGGVNGYLPIGQFASGSGWGALYTDGTNTGSTKKFTNGVEATGVSLGMLGGYVQFDTDPTGNTNNRITNDADHIYGIDFVVYGNAFVGNPEAASVMVSENGKDWYNLAGSRHYFTDPQHPEKDTLHNVNVSYLKVVIPQNESSVTIGGKTFTQSGVYCSKDYATAYVAQNDVDLAIGAATWSGVPNINGTTTILGTSAWPEYTAENYGNVWNIGGSAVTASATNFTATGNVHWQQGTNSEVITYCGLTEVPDDMVVTGNTNSTTGQAAQTDVYRWGYADVRPNGSYYGSATNPYATSPSAGAISGVGGDGFDLSWAVNADGTPHPMSSVRYIRVYTSVLYHAGNVGETSAEVCGLYAVGTTGTGAATSDIEVWADDAQEAHVINVGGTTDVNPGTYYVYSSENYVYKNGSLIDASGENGYEISVASGELIQIITQSGTESPFLTVLRGTSL